MEHFLEGIVLLTPISNKCLHRNVPLWHALEGHGGDLSSQKLNDWAMWINSIY